ncbi:D-alanyl-D-alanine carboxypeptidase family protein [Paracoccus seriniphilus]|uniref:D-alanyl-D-alanine carboxypeptidase family protein n=1 Tax=Paracoccus seriniphilus TaxID=184748 RepID=UPI0035632896
MTARLWAFILLTVLAPASLSAAPFAAYVMDARTGKPVYQQNADTKLHPASLTKMMTLYLAFTAIERGQVRLDSKVVVSSNAAAEPPSKLGLRAGQKIELRYLIRAAAIKSANDAATAIGEGLAGSETAFAQQMTAMAKALGMRNTHFMNANGLTQEGHYSTAHDMSILGRRLFYDFPQYYNLFSRRSADAGIKKVSSTNRRFLDAYEGADGIKTGYTRAAGFNLTASAQRGNKRLIATVFGGTSTAQRNQVMAQLLDEGFKRVPSRVREVRPRKPQLLTQKVVRRAKVAPKAAATSPAPQKLVLKSSEPPARVPRNTASTAAVSDPLAAAVRKATQTRLSGSSLRLTASTRPPLRPAVRGNALEKALAAAGATAPDDRTATQSASLAAPVLQASARPLRAPRSRGSTAAIGDQDAEAIARAVAAATSSEGQPSLALLASPAPKPRSETVILAAMGEGDISEPEELEIVSRPADSGRYWGVNLGLYRSHIEAEKLLLKTALQDGTVLDGADRRIADTNRGFQAKFVNLSKADAYLACERLRARSQSCSVVGP